MEDRYKEQNVEMKYISMGNNQKGYPVSITVKMEDGTEQIFKR